MTKTNILRLCKYSFLSGFSFRFAVPIPVPNFSSVLHIAGAQKGRTLEFLLSKVGHLWLEDDLLLNSVYSLKVKYQVASLWRLVSYCESLISDQFIILRCILHLSGSITDLVCATRSRIQLCILISVLFLGLFFICLLKAWILSGLDDLIRNILLHNFQRINELPVSSLSKYYCLYYIIVCVEFIASALA